ncbi:hypothetical protein BGZ49_002732 [Haplosporangium sp. Z 27]|nr:hypothetical protein BGZ49_002732 [Haplosporangium sp. Z 27]
MISTTSSSYLRKEPSLVDMSKHHHSDTNVSNDINNTILKNTISNSGHNKAPSGIKSLSFLKNHNHSHSTDSTIQPGNSSSTNSPHKSSSKSSSKSKSTKQDQAAAHIEDPTPYYQSGKNSGFLNDYDHNSTQAVASFNAIFQSQTKTTLDERIMLEEWLQKRSNSLQMVWKRRWCVLRDDGLYYYRSDTETKPLGILHLDNYSNLTYGPDLARKSKFAFRLSSPENSDHLFHAETPQAFDLWLDALQGHIRHALSRRDVLSPLDVDQQHEQPGNPFTNDLYKSTGEQSIIDKVLDRLHLEDPTLSDMNDPSTLIMPAQEHHHSFQKSFRDLQLSLGDDLDGWSPPPSSALYSSSNTSASANTSMSMDAHHVSRSNTETSSTSSQRSPIGIQRTTNYGMSFGSENHSQSSASSFTDPYSNYSSFSEVSFGGNSGNRSARASMQILDSQGRPSLQQGRGTTHALHSSPSPLSGVQHLNHYHTQFSPTPSLYPYRVKGQTLSLETGGLPLSEHSMDSPFSSPMTSLASSYQISPICPDLKRTESSGSTNSISTIDSALGEAIITHDIASVKGLTMTPLDLIHKKPTKEGSGSSGSSQSTPVTNKKMIWSKGYCTDNDLLPFEILDKESNAASMNEGKKAKKLWSVYGNSGSITISDKTGSGNNGSGNNRKTTNQSLDSNNAMLKNLVLISPVKKNNSGSKGSNTTSTTKGFSKSMTSLSKVSESEAHNHPVPPFPVSPSNHHHNHHVFSPDTSSASRVRSPSVSVLDEALAAASREYAEYTQKQFLNRPPAHNDDILYSRSPAQQDSNSFNLLKKSIQGQKQQSKQPPSSRATTAPISLITSDWNTISRTQRNQSQPIRCIDPELQQHRLHQPFQPHASKPTETISRHIVAPDELAMALAIDQEAEGKRREQERIEKTEENNNRPISIMTANPMSVVTSTPLASPVEGNNLSDDKSPLHPVTSLSAIPESVVSPSMNLTTVEEATSSFENDGDDGDNNTYLPGEDINANFEEESSPPPKNYVKQTQTATVSTSSQWSLPPPRRQSHPPDQEATRSLTEQILVEKKYTKGTGVENTKQSPEPIVKNESLKEDEEAHEVLLSAIEATVESQSTCTANTTREWLKSPTLESPSPPILPRRSPFRSAPIPPINLAYPTPP